MLVSTEGLPGPVMVRGFDLGYDSTRASRHYQPPQSLQIPVRLAPSECALRLTRSSGSRSTGIDGVPTRKLRFAGDSPLEEAGFELVWGFSCQVVVLGFAESSLFGAGKPFFIPSPAIRFAERAEGVKGPKR